MSNPVYYCDQCRCEITFVRNYVNQVSLECHGGLQIFDYKELSAPEEYPIDPMWGNEKREQFIGVKIIRCFKTGQHDHFRQIRSVIKFLGMQAAVISAERLMRMEEKELTAEFKRQGMADGFNMGVSCEIHPWFHNVRFFYQDGPSDDEELWPLDMPNRQVRRDVSYREKVNQLKFGDKATWPSKYQDFFPKPKSATLTELITRA